MRSRARIMIYMLALYDILAITCAACRHRRHCASELWLSLVRYRRREGSWGRRQRAPREEECTDQERQPRRRATGTARRAGWVRIASHLVMPHETAPPAQTLIECHYLGATFLPSPPSLKFFEEQNKHERHKGSTTGRARCDST